MMEQYVVVRVHDDMHVIFLLLQKFKRGEQLEDDETQHKEDENDEGEIYTSPYDDETT